MNATKTINDIVYLRHLIRNLILLAIIHYEGECIKSRLQNRGNVRNPFATLQNSIVGNFKFFFERIKGDSNALPLVVIVQYLLPNNCGSHCRNTLLAVNKNLFARGLCSVLQLNIRVLPYNDISYRKSLIQRVNQVSNFGTIPNKRTLHFWNCNTSGFYIRKQCFDCVIINAITCHTLSLTSIYTSSPHLCR